MAGNIGSNNPQIGPSGDPFATPSDVKEPETSELAPTKKVESPLTAQDQISQAQSDPGARVRALVSTYDAPPDVPSLPAALFDSATAALKGKIESDAALTGLSKIIEEASIKMKESDFDDPAIGDHMMMIFALLSLIDAVAREINEMMDGISESIKARLGDIPDYGRIADLKEQLEAGGLSRLERAGLVAEILKELGTTVKEEDIPALTKAMVKMAKVGYSITQQLNILLQADSHSDNGLDSKALNGVTRRMNGILFVGRFLGSLGGLFNRIMISIVTLGEISLAKNLHSGGGANSAGPEGGEIANKMNIFKNIERLAASQAEETEEAGDIEELTAILKKLIAQLMALLGLAAVVSDTPSINHETSA
jgi:hypothetical protein